MQAARCIEPIHRDDRRRPGRPQVSTLVDVRSQRSVVDYGLARRATLAALRGSGPTTREDVCDAHPYLLRAARHHGVPTDRDCPVCGRCHLTTVSYVYGEELGSREGRVKTPRELEEMARELPATEKRPQLEQDHRLKIHALTKEPPKKDRVERWREQMSEEDRKAFEDVAGELLDELGYKTGEPVAAAAGS